MVGMADDRPHAEVRGIIESNLDDLVDGIEVQAEALSQADVEVDEETLTAYIHGFQSGIITSYYLAERDQEIPGEAIRMIDNITSRRKPEIVNAYREEFGDFP